MDEPVIENWIVVSVCENWKLGQYSRRVEV